MAARQVLSEVTAQEMRDLGVGRPNWEVISTAEASSFWGERRCRHCCCCWSLEGKQANCSPQEQGTGNKLHLRWYKMLPVPWPSVVFMYLCTHETLIWSIDGCIYSFLNHPFIHTCMRYEGKNRSPTGVYNTHKKKIYSCIQNQLHPTAPTYLMRWPCWLE